MAFVGLVVGVLLGGGLIWTAVRPEQELRSFAAPRLAALITSKLPTMALRVMLLTGGVLLCVLTIVAYVSR